VLIVHAPETASSTTPDDLITDQQNVIL